MMGLYNIALVYVSAWFILYVYVCVCVYVYI